MEIADQKIWDEFVASQPHSPLLQSWAWGEFNLRLGHKVWRLGLKKNGRLVAVAQVLGIPRRLGYQLYVPHGPVASWHDRQSVSQILDEIKSLAKESGADYLRIEPLQEKSDQITVLISENGFQSAPTFVQQEAGLLLNLEPSEEELLANLRKTTRYEVRRAPKMGVTVNQSKDFKVFAKLLAETVERHGFVPQATSYLEKQFKALSEAGAETLWTASQGRKVLATAIIAIYGDTATYLHGASVKSKIPASYALQWEAIKDAKSKGLKIYDFWGIAPNDNPRHPWAGLTAFKLGFGGTPVTYTSAWDYPLSVRYTLIALTERIRKMLRRT